MHDHKHAVDWAAISDHMARSPGARGSRSCESSCDGSTCPREPPSPTSAAVPAAWSSCSPSRSAPTGMVYAVDGNEAMRAATQAVVEACGVDAWVRVLAGDLEHQDLRSIVGRELDLVHASAVVHHLADEVDGLRRLATALALGWSPRRRRRRAAHQSSSGRLRRRSPGARGPDARAPAAVVLEHRSPA